MAGNGEEGHEQPLESQSMKYTHFHCGGFSVDGTFAMVYFLFMLIHMNRTIYINL